MQQLVVRTQFCLSSCLFVCPSACLSVSCQNSWDEHDDGSVFMPSPPSPHCQPSLRILSQALTCFFFSSSSYITTINNSELSDWCTLGYDNMYQNLYIRSDVTEMTNWEWVRFCVVIFRVMVFKVWTAFTAPLLHNKGV